MSREFVALADTLVDDYEISDTLVAHSVALAAAAVPIMLGDADRGLRVLAMSKPRRSC